MPSPSPDPRVPRACDLDGLLALPHWTCTPVLRCSSRTPLLHPAFAQPGNAAYSAQHKDTAFRCRPKHQRFAMVLVRLLAGPVSKKYA
eukprot:2913162-Amphidinium_carterae.1